MNDDIQKYLLVSDSNEISSQYDSKKLSESTLVKIVQDNLFGKELGIITNYLTNSQYNNNKSNLERTKNQLVEEFNSLSRMNVTRKFQVVDGQVILIHKDSIPQNINVEDYIRTYWEIPTNYRLQRLDGCMLRGVTYQSKIGKTLNTLNSGDYSASLENDNLPPHMHQSSITSGAKLESIKTGKNKTELSTSNPQYDMFRNDSISTGLQRNEVDGVVDQFKGEEIGQIQGNSATHNNLPNYSEFYAYAVLSNNI